MSDPKFPEVHCQLLGTSSHALAIVSRVQKALRKHGCPKDVLDTFFKEATSGSYDHVIQTAMNWVTVH